MPEYRSADMLRLGWKGVVDTRPVILPEFARMPSTVVLDLDGTLLDPDAMLRPRSRDAVAAILDLGVPVVLATARPLRSIRARVEPDLLDRVALVQMNGAAIRPAGAPWISTARLSMDAATQVLTLASALAGDARAMCELEGDVFGCDIPLDPEALWRTNSATPEMVIPLAEAFARGAAKIAINGLGQPLGDLTSRLREELRELVDVIDEGSGTFVNVVPRGVSKQAALCRLLDDEPWTGVLAFGDDIADIEVLRSAEYGVAMANAHPTVLEVAPYRTLSNAEDGVACVLESLFLRFG